MLQTRTEFDSKLVDSVAEVLFRQDWIGLPPEDWDDLSNGHQSTYLDLAQAALQATYDFAKVEEEFAVIGTMPIEDHPDYVFRTDTFSELPAAEAYRLGLVEQYGSEGATFVIEHRVQLRLKVHRYWTQEDIDEIDKRAADLAKKIAKHVD